MKAKATMSGLPYFYNYLFYRIQNFYRKIGVDKGSRFYAWLILSLLECLNILSIFYILILASVINVQTLGGYKLYVICLLCLIINAVYFFRRKSDKKQVSQFTSLPEGKARTWQVFLSVYVIFSLAVFAILMFLVRNHLQGSQATAPGSLPFPMRQK